MSFDRIIPDKSLSSYIECYWIIENDDTKSYKQKIIPDGYPEIITHYGDPYRINIKGKWEGQSKNLVAGQVKRYFYLENTGVSGVFGIKLKPAALTHLFNIRMDDLVDKVISIDGLREQKLEALFAGLTSRDNPARIVFCNQYLQEMIALIDDKNDIIDDAINMIFESKGTIEMSNICKRLFITERHLQRLFKKYIGIPPKTYSRIVRFNYIFQLIKNNTPFTQIAFDAGYYDLSHFSRNFKNFTGEEPSGYFFEEKNLANFFLKKADK